MSKLLQLHGHCWLAVLWGIHRDKVTEPHGVYIHYVQLYGIFIVQRWALESCGNTQCALYQDGLFNTSSISSNPSSIITIHIKLKSNMSTKCN